MLPERLELSSLAAEVFETSVYTIPPQERSWCSSSIPYRTKFGAETHRYGTPLGRFTLERVNRVLTTCQLLHSLGLFTTSVRARGGSRTRVTTLEEWDNGRYMTRAYGSDKIVKITLFVNMMISLHADRASICDPRSDSRFTTSGQGGIRTHDHKLVCKTSALGLYATWPDLYFRRYLFRLWGFFCLVANVSVCVWQFGQTKRRLVILLLSELPSLWSSCKTRGNPLCIGGHLHISHISPLVSLR